jgi:hypothetical protein
MRRPYCETCRRGPAPWACRNAATTGKIDAAFTTFERERPDAVFAGGGEFAVIQPVASWTWPQPAAANKGRDLPSARRIRRGGSARRLTLGPVR